MEVVPYDIEQLCTLKAARELLISSDRNVIVPEGGAGLRNSDKIDKIDSKIEKLEGNYTSLTAIDDAI